MTKETQEISKSYPFLSIARKYNVPYWAVLCYADFINNLFNDTLTDAYRKGYWCMKAFETLDKFDISLLSKLHDECLNSLRQHSRIV